MAYLESEEQRVSNLQSVAIGQLGVQLAYIAWGFAGGKGAKPAVTVKDFLPFPEWKPPSEKYRAGPSDETKTALTRVFRSRQIPPHVYTQLMTPPEDGT